MDYLKKEYGDDATVSFSWLSGIQFPQMSLRIRDTDNSSWFGLGHIIITNPAGETVCKIQTFIKEKKIENGNPWKNF